MSSDPTLLSIIEVSQKIRTCDISPVELVESSLEKIKKYNERLNAFVSVAPRRAFKAAEQAEAEISSGRYLGPLHGIPIGVKDIIDTEGIVTTYGSILFKDHIPRQDANVLTRLKKAGAIIIGKTNTHEFALGATTNNPHYGPTRNPWNLELIPGGSSGGSAAGTAANLCFAALGTDTGGSVRIPAAFCGLVGLKPTYGRVSLHGVYPLATGFDHVGPITRTVHDAAILLQSMAGGDEKDANSLMEPVPTYKNKLNEFNIEGSKIAIFEELSQLPLDHEIDGSYRTAIFKIEQLGGEIVEVKKKNFERIEKVSTSLTLAEAAVSHHHLLSKKSTKYGGDVLRRLRAGQQISIHEFINSLRSRETITREFEMLFEKVNYILTPSAQILPPKINQETVYLDSEEISVLSGCARFTRLANLIRMPAIVIPFGYSTKSIPLSIQLMAPRLKEKELLMLAYALEKATPNLRSRRPPL